MKKLKLSLDSNLLETLENEKMKQVFGGYGGTTWVTGYPTHVEVDDGNDH